MFSSPATIKVRTKVWLSIAVAVAIAGTVCLLLYARARLHERKVQRAMQAMTTPEGRQAIIRQYESKASTYPDNVLLPVAMCYAMEERYEEAEKLYARFLAVEPNSARGHRGMGSTCLGLRKNQEAIEHWQKGWSLGDVPSLSCLVSFYLSIGQVDKVKPLVPTLLGHKDGDHDIPYLLIAYSVNTSPQDRELFKKVVDGLTDEQLLAQTDDTLKVILYALDRFGDKERAATLRAKMQARDKSKQAETPARDTSQQTEPAPP